MKKVLLAAVLLAGMVSCVKKDDVVDATAPTSTQLANAAAGEMVPKKVVETSYGTKTSIMESVVTYVDGNKIATVKTPNDLIKYTYQGDLLVSSDSKDGDVTINTKYVYNANGKLSSKITTKSNGNNSQTDYTYNSNGKVTSVIGTTKSSFPNVINGVTTTVTSTWKTVTDYTYTSSTNASFKSTSSSTYSPVQQGVNSPDYVVTGTLLFDAKGNIIAKEDDKGNKTTSTFDDKPTVLSYIKGFDATFEKDGDAEGFIDVNNRTSHTKIYTSPAGTTTKKYTSEFTYDAKGRVTKETQKLDGVLIETTEYTY